MNDVKYLDLDAYCQLFEHIILAEYDNLFHNAELRQDLGLSDEDTARFAMEYLCAALYLFDDVVPDSRFSEDVCNAVTATVRTHIFSGILEHAEEGMDAMYILYSLRRSAVFDALYTRNDETMKLLIENCIEQAQLSDTVAHMPQGMYLMQLLSGLLQLFCDLLCSAELDRTEPIRFRIEVPTEQAEEQI